MKKKNNEHIQLPNQAFYHDTNNSHVRLSQKLGTPAHEEYLRMSEFDERRHRKWCENYKSDTKTCIVYNSKCYGASHCIYYSCIKKNATLTKVQKHHHNQTFTLQSSKSEKIKNNSDIIYYNDNVTLYSYADKEQINITIKSEGEELPPVHKECLFHGINHMFNVNNFRYKIVTFKKN